MELKTNRLSQIFLSTQTETLSRNESYRGGGGMTPRKNTPTREVSESEGYLLYLEL